MTTLRLLLEYRFDGLCGGFFDREGFKVFGMSRASDRFYFVRLLPLVPLTTLFLLRLTQGSHLWTQEFWHNMQEFNNYFLSGFGLMPMYETIQNKETLAGLMGFFIPVVYMGTLLVTRRAYLLSSIKAR